MLPVRALGDSELALSSIGLGTWAIGGIAGHGWGAQDDVVSIATIRRAVERGIGWIDTAPIYGLGHAEKVVGEALRGFAEPDRALVFTKCGLVPGPGRGGVLSNLDPAVIRRECDASLRRLQVEHVDVLQLHYPDETGVAIEDSWAAMLDLVAAGKVRVPAVSNFTVAQLARCEQISHVGCCQPPLSMIRREALSDVIPWAAEHNTGVVTYSPLQSGLLTAAFTRRRVRSLPDDDWRRSDALFSSPAIDRVLDLVDQLCPLAEEVGTSVSAIAIAWVLDQPGVTAAIVGARHPDQVDSWVEGGRVRLAKDQSRRIAAAIESSCVGSGPVMSQAL